MKHSKLACCLFGVLHLIVIVYVYEHSKSTSGSENNVSQQLHHIPKSQLANLIPGNVSHTSPNASDQNVTNNRPEGVSQRAQNEFSATLEEAENSNFKGKGGVRDVSAGINGSGQAELDAFGGSTTKEPCDVAKALKS
eukprot:142494_1